MCVCARVCVCACASKIVGVGVYNTRPTQNIDICNDPAAREAAKPVAKALDPEGLQTVLVHLYQHLAINIVLSYNSLVLFHPVAELGAAAP